MGSMDYQDSDLAQQISPSSTYHERALITRRKTAAMTASKKDELELLARLQAQFGDMNVEGMFRDPDGSDVSDDESESSLEEPSAEELRAWQDAQFAKGKMRQDAKKSKNSVTDGNVRTSALQRRRHNKTTSQLTLMREDEKNEEADEWVKVTSTPNLGGKASVFFPTAIQGDAVDADEAVNPLLQKLVEGDPEVLGTKWARLYSSSEGDGLSFRYVCEKLRGYEGPTVLLIGGIPSASKLLGQIKNDDRVALGFFTTDSWIESTDYFGSDDCFLFSINRNDVQLLRPKSRSQSSSSALDKKYIYCNPSSLATSNKRMKDAPSRTNGSVHGMGIGGTASQPRLHISESLEECRALPYDQLFDDGDLLSGICSQSLYYFDVDCIEVWGVGGEEWIEDALQAHNKAKEMKAAGLEKARKVDKRQLLDAFENGLELGNLFGYRNLVSERCDC